jgi:hypothetical protein
MSIVQTGPLAVRHSFAAKLADDLSLPDIRQVLAAFAQDLDRLTAGLAGAGDAAAFRRAAHALCGAAGAVGAMRLASLCRDAARPELPAILHEAGGIRTELGRVLTWLDRHG